MAEASITVDIVYDEERPYNRAKRVEIAGPEIWLTRVSSIRFGTVEITDNR